MEEMEARRLVAAEGKVLLETGLVARTWGNVSCRVDRNHFVITPSGLDYEHMTPEDLVMMSIDTGEAVGNRKPSSEKGIHLAAYELKPETNYCIHTHQTYATAIGLGGITTLQVTKEEQEKLGGMCVASYGISSTKKLAKQVYQALQTGANIIFMIHHGVLICGSSRKEAFERATLLEEICYRNYRMPGDDRTLDPSAQHMISQVSNLREGAQVVCTKETLAAAELGRSIPAQVDDMAQMIGKKIPFVNRANSDEVVAALDKCGAVLIKDVGIIVWDPLAEEREALKVLTQKAAIVYLHTQACHVKGTLGSIDVFLQHLIYRTKYAKQKNK